MRGLLGIITAVAIAWSPFSAGMAVESASAPESPYCDEKHQAAPDQLAQWRAQAEKGDSGALCSLGMAYYIGKGGLEKNPAEAMKWFRKSAEQGNARAQYFMGTLYQPADFLREDVQPSVWIWKAAEQGEPDAQALLAVAYMFGGSVPKDEMQAVKWYRKAAEGGNASAQWFMANAYHDGEVAGIPKDLVQAYMWRSLSLGGSLQGKKGSDAQKRIAEYEQGMKPEEIGKAKRLVQEWKPRKP